MKSNNISFLLNEREILRSLDRLYDSYDRKARKLSEYTTGVPGFQLKVCPHRKTYQCYLRDVKAGRTFFVSSRDPRCRKIAQSEYNKKQLKLVERRKRLLLLLLNEIKKGDLSVVYGRMSEGRRSLIETSDKDDASFLEEWKSEKYDRKPFVSDETVYLTAAGLRVRSKSEILIAEELDRRNVPYKYERPVCVDGVILHPDFTVLNPVTRREVIWEHFGLMDDMNYRDEFLKKIKAYENSGYVNGVNFVFTAETSRVPLTRADILETVNKIVG